MADVTISNLSPITPSTGLVLPVSNGTSTGKVTLSQVCGVMTSAQITTALGYTPYNGTTNPNGYITASSLPNNKSLAKAWVSFDGLRNAAGTSILDNTNRFLRSTFNVSSVLRNGVGDYTVNFTPGALSTAQYCAIATCDHQTPNTRFAGFTNTRTSTSLRVTIESTNGFGASRIDSAYIGVVVFE